jgi:hypothetical protein
MRFSRRRSRESEYGTRSYKSQVKVRKEASRSGRGKGGKRADRESSRSGRDGVKKNSSSGLTGEAGSVSDWNAMGES